MNQLLRLAKGPYSYKLPAPAEMTSFDQQTIASGISGTELMEKAGKQLYVALEKIDSELLDKSVVVLVGPGNNGGDGLVIARELQQSGRKVTAILAAARHYSADLLLQINRFLACGGSLFFYSGSTELNAPVELLPINAEAIKDIICNSAVVIDALLGTGQGRAPRDVLGELVALLDATKNLLECDFKTIAIDLPSGVDADSGRVFTPHVNADLTLTVEVVKRGLLQYPAREACGEIEAVEIGIDCSGSCEFFLLTNETAPRLPARSLAAHKGSFGHVLVVGGSRQMPGAPHLAAMAALRSGTGLVTKTVLDTAVAEFSAPELLLCPVVDQQGYFEVGHLSQLMPALEAATCLIVGPGLGRADATVDFVAELVIVAKTLSLPMIIDADGLNCLALLIKRGFNKDLSGVILTPHPGEAGRMLDIGATEVQQDRYQAAKQLALRTQAVVALKGAGTVIYVNGHGWVDSTANPYLATAGSGDVLTGIIAALVVQGLTCEQAACLGVFGHGLAGELASQQTGGAIIASDFLQHLPSVLAQFSLH